MTCTPINNLVLDLVHTNMQLYDWPWQIMLTNQAIMLYSYADHYAPGWALFYASLTGLEFNFSIIILLTDFKLPCNTRVHVLSL